MRRNFQSRAIHTLLWLFVAFSLGVLGYYLSFGPKTFEIINHRIIGLDLSLAFRIDALSSIMFVMVAILSAVISQYAVRYLDGEKRQNYFYRYLFLTVLPVFFLVLSSNLIMFLISWFGISWGLHQLLLFYKERPGALASARKKFLVSRVGDVFILIAVILLYQVFGTFEFDVIFARASQEAHTYHDLHQWSLDIASLCLVIGAMTKSVQFPFHFWLPETMETPTPVSALMHAGIINAGGFLVIRLSEVIAHGEWASMLLAAVGSFTAVYGALVMATQNSIKSKLAYSTISQMGMMMFALGIGAFHFALFHIVAHSFYKAYAFMTTGQLVEEKKKISLSLKPVSFPFALVLAALCYSLVIVGNAWNNGEYLAQLTYLSVLALGLCQSVQAGSLNIPGRLKFSLAVTITVLLGVGVYVGLEGALGKFVAIEGPVHGGFWLCSLTFSVFAMGFFIAREMMEGQSKLARSFYMLFWNDSYIGIHTSRIVARLWPRS